MLKIFSTQLHGIFQTIAEKNEFAIEDSARMMAQTILSHGHIYVYGRNELASLSAHALYSNEALPGVAMLPDDLTTITATDTVLIAAPTKEDEEANERLRAIKATSNAYVIFLAASSNRALEHTGVDSFIQLFATKGLVPNEAGERVGLPTSMAALYAYHALHLTTQEILEEYE
ncbi:hypothetical protein A374_18599 [Fictibacillus macauensis ZFHKF-1]|uniref:DUF2529 domain-containing protein n=1 Tax=Fictibacillus macauensis ZFHKF-1 TaxID=1196324 RepID=I8IWI6_9BACL|nr:DUF2529 family protein [Fictibacillus macauensis]EIT83866.1 hypothetical protein A374_18599 [Fictibacillus macauensis ZFHKF-1]